MMKYRADRIAILARWKKETPRLYAKELAGVVLVALENTPAPTIYRKRAINKRETIRLSLFSISFKEIIRVRTVNENPPRVPDNRAKLLQESLRLNDHLQSRLR